MWQVFCFYILTSVVISAQTCNDTTQLIAGRALAITSASRSAVFLSLAKELRATNPTMAITLYENAFNVDASQEEAIRRYYQVEALSGLLSRDWGLVEHQARVVLAEKLIADHSRMSSLDRQLAAKPLVLYLIGQGFKDQALRIFDQVSDKKFAFVAANELLDKPELTASDRSQIINDGRKALAVATPEEASAALRFARANRDFLPNAEVVEFARQLKSQLQARGSMVLGADGLESSTKVLEVMCDQLMAGKGNQEVVDAALASLPPPPPLAPERSFLQAALSDPAKAAVDFGAYPLTEDQKYRIAAIVSHKLISTSPKYADVFWQEAVARKDKPIEVYDLELLNVDVAMYLRLSKQNYGPQPTLIERIAVGLERLDLKAQSQAVSLFFALSGKADAADAATLRDLGDRVPPVFRLALAAGVTARTCATGGVQ